MQCCAALNLAKAVSLVLLCVVVFTIDHSVGNRRLVQNMFEYFAELVYLKSFIWHNNYYVCLVLH